MLSDIYAKCHKITLYAECHYAEGLYAECRGTKILTEAKKHFAKKSVKLKTCSKLMNHIF